MSTLKTVRDTILSVGFGALCGLMAQRGIDHHSERMMVVAGHADHKIARLSAELPRKQAEAEKYHVEQADIVAEVKKLAEAVKPANPEDFTVVGDILEKYQQSVEAVTEQARFLSGIHAGIERRLFPERDDHELKLSRLIANNGRLHGLTREFHSHNESLAVIMVGLPEPHQKDLQKHLTAYNKLAGLLTDAVRLREDVLTYLQDNLPLAVQAGDKAQHSLDRIIHRELHRPSDCEVRRVVDEIVETYARHRRNQKQSQDVAVKSIETVVSVKLNGVPLSDGEQQVYRVVQGLFESRGRTRVGESLESFRDTESAIDIYVRAQQLMKELLEVTRAAKEARVYVGDVRGGLRRIARLQVKAELDLEDAVRHGRREIEFQRQLVDTSMKRLMLDMGGYESVPHTARQMQQALEPIQYIPVATAFVSGICFLITSSLYRSSNRRAA